MIEIQGLTKRFGDLVAVDHLTLSFRPGVTGLVGENGAGKSTLFRCLANVYDVDEGQILIDDLPCDMVKAKEKLFFLSDNPYYPRGTNAKGVASFYRGICDLDVQRFYEILGDFELPLDRGVGRFSKGMRRQLFIALALSTRCQYLLLDEAFDGLDPLVVEKIKTTIYEEGQKGRTIVVSSHNIPVLEHLADRFVLLHKGKLGKEGKNGDMGTSFVKFQGSFPHELTQPMLEGLGLQVVSFRQVGSVYHFVLIDGEGLGEKIVKAYDPTFLEAIPIEPDELLVLEMMLAKKGGRPNA